MLHDMFQYFINLPADTWYHTAEWLLSAGIVPVAIQAAKHYRGKFAEVTRKFSISLLGILSFLVAAAQAIVGSGINLGGLGENGLAIAGVATFLYHIGVSPLYKKWFAKAQEAIGEPTVPVLAPAGVPATQGFESQ